MARRKSKTRRWVADKQRDPYARAARAAGYRSRAAFKLQQMDEQDRLFARARRVLDLGAAPGGWSQYARDSLADGTVVAVDLLPMAPIDGVTFVQGDFTDAAVQQRILALAAPDAYDLVISDMAPNITGIADVDQANAAGLAEEVINFSGRMLAKNGILLVKLFEGSETARIRGVAESKFQRATVRKPRASRDRSREIYLLLRGLRD